MNKFLLVWLCSILLWNCADRSETPIKNGRLSFSLAKKEPAGGRKLNQGEQPKAVRLSILTHSGEWAAEHRILPLLKFGSGYVTESIELLPGTYAVTEFLVLNENNEVIYATPLEGSDRAVEVEQPLPLFFDVQQDISSEVTLQVVPIQADEDPESFGYANFRFEIVNKQPGGIVFHFTASIPDAYTTDGLDSAFIVFTKRTEEKVVRLNLSITSPVEAMGRVTYPVLDLGETTYWPDWQMTVHAFYEVTDEVEANAHINEQVVEFATVPIRHETASIRLSESEFSLADNNGTYVSYDPSHIHSRNVAHLPDATHAFHIIASNDLCEAEVTYRTYRHAYIFLGEKYIWNDGAYDAYRYFSVDELQPGIYHTTTEFADMCPEDRTGLMGYLYIIMAETPDIQRECLLVWLADNPGEYSDGRTKNTRGTFKVLPANQLSLLKSKANG